MQTDKIKIAIFDIDNTLIKRGLQTAPESAHDAIQKLKDKGIEVMIATGRAAYFVQEDVFKNIKPNFLVGINGAYALDKDQDIFFSVPMDREEVNDMIEFCRKNGLGVAGKMRREMHVYNDMNIYQTVYLQGNPNKHILKDHTLEGPILEGEEVPLGLFIMGNESLIEEMNTPDKDAYFSYAYPNAYDVYSKRAGKIKGIEEVLGDLEMTWDNVIAFGDADNDIDMIKHAGIGVAMGNGIDSLKEVADYVTKDLDEDGVYHAVQSLNLI